MKLPDKVKKMLPVLVFLVLGAALNSYFSAVSNNRASTPEDAAMLSTQGEAVIAPEFELTDLTSRTFRLGDLRGKLVMLNFWATW